MKRQFTLGVVTLLIAAPALATESRVEGMGGIGTYITDDTNQFIWPQLAGQYAGNAYAELKSVGSPDAVQSGGATFTAPRFSDYTVGLYLNRSSVGYLLHSYTSAMDFGGLTTLLINRGNLGLGLSWGGDTQEVDMTTIPDGTLTKETTSVNQVSLGYTGQFFGRSTTDAAARVVLASGEQTYQGNVGDAAGGGGTVPADVDESNFAFEFAARNHYEKRRGGKVISSISFGMASGNIDAEDLPAATFDSKTETSAMALGLGVGWEMPVTGNTKATFVCEPFTYRKLEMTSFADDDGGGGDGETEDTILTSTTTTLPSFFFAVEGAIRSWLDGRMGVAQVWGRNTAKTETTGDSDVNGSDPTGTSETKSAVTDFEISFGMTVKVNETWKIDGVFNDAHLFGGPNIVSGSAPGPFFAKVSVTGTW